MMLALAFGICRYCGKPAGLFRHVHSECEALHAGFRGKVRHALDGVLVSNARFDGVVTAISERTREAKRYLASQGVFTGGERPFGYALRQMATLFGLSRTQRRWRRSSA
jgi:hypothetical protein